MSLPKNNNSTSSSLCFLIIISELSVFDLQELECRYLFSLVSKTDNSDNTIKKHREEEVELLFFGKDNYNSILIDDIIEDKKKFEKNHFK